MFGFSIAENQTGPHRIDYIESNSLASQNGFRVNDLILNVNGFDCIGIPFKKLSELLERECQQSSLKLSLIQPSECPQEILDFPQFNKALINSTIHSSISSNKSTRRPPLENVHYSKKQIADELAGANPERVGEQVTYIKIRTNDGSRIKSLGIGMSGNSIITQLEQNSVALSNGLKIGDRIVFVNDLNVREKERNEIAELIRKKYDNLTLGIIRPNNNNENSSYVAPVVQQQQVQPEPISK